MALVGWLTVFGGPSSIHCTRLAGATTGGCAAKAFVNVLSAL
jgi:hypothetical protein